MATLEDTQIIVLFPLPTVVGGKRCWQPAFYFDAAAKTAAYNPRRFQPAHRLWFAQEFLFRAYHNEVHGWSVTAELPDDDRAVPNWGWENGPWDIVRKTLTDIAVGPVVVRHHGDLEYRWLLTEQTRNNAYLQLGVWPD